MEKGKKRLFLILTTALALVLAAGITSVFAAETGVEVSKTLDLNNCTEENGVDVVTSFMVEPAVVPAGISYTPVNAQDQAGTPQAIKPGVGGGLYVKAGEAGQIKFSASEVESAVNSIGERTKEVLGIDPTVFTEAGIYRYIVSEVDSRQPGVTYDDTKYYVDLHIIAAGETNQYECQAVIVHDENKGYSSKENAQGAHVINDKKFISFTNTYSTYHAEAEKHITGNQRNDNDKFDFQVEFFNILAERIINITLVGSDGTTPVGTYSVAVSPGVENMASEIIKVGKNQHIKVHGLYSGETFEIVELQDGQSRGYITKVDDGDFGNPSAGATTEVTTIRTADSRHEFWNNKSGSVPTGIFINNWPYLAAAMAAVVAAVIIFRRRRSESFDEDL